MAGVVAQKGDDLPAGIFSQDGKIASIFMSLTGDRVEKAGLIAEFECLREHVRAGAVNGDRKIGNCLNGVDHPPERLYLLRLGNRGAAVNKRCARPGLGNGALLDEIRVAPRNGRPQRPEWSR